MLLSFNCHLRLFSELEAAGVGTCGFFNSNGLLSSANIIKITLALGGEERSSHYFSGVAYL